MNLFVDILFGVFVFAILVQIFYAFYFFIRLSFYIEKSESFTQGVSVIICAKDEADMLYENIPSFLEQDYPNFEVIVVDDQSVDGTKYLLKDLEKKYFNLKVVTIDPHVISRVGKKFALTLGIKTAKYDYVLLSDADCRVFSKHWITKMTSSFVSKEIVLGISPYRKSKGILNKFIRYDEFLVMLQYLSYALAKIPYMGVGRNLAYKKSLFFNVKGFASHIHIPSGDDDLFIKEVANSDNVAIKVHEDANILSEPKITFSEWSYQRKRHISTSKYYKKMHKILLFFFPFSQFLFWMSSILLFVLHQNIILISTLFFFRILVYYSVYYPIMKKLRQFDLFFIYPIMEFLFLLVQLFFVLLNPRYKTNSWK